MRRLTVLVLIAAMAVGLSACGRKGKPIAPEGSAYPHHYPDISFPPAPQGGNAPDAQSGTETQVR